MTIINTFADYYNDATMGVGGPGVTPEEEKVLEHYWAQMAEHYNPVVEEVLGKVAEPVTELNSTFANPAHLLCERLVAVASSAVYEAVAKFYAGDCTLQDAVMDYARAANKFNALYTEMWANM